MCVGVCVFVSLSRSSRVESKCTQFGNVEEVGCSTSHHLRVVRDHRPSVVW